MKSAKSRPVYYTIVLSPPPRYIGSDLIDSAKSCTNGLTPGSAYGRYPAALMMVRYYNRRYIIVATGITSTP